MKPTPELGPTRGTPFEMVAERRKPLVLSSTRALLDSVLTQPSPPGDSSSSSSDLSRQVGGDRGGPAGVRLNAGILRCPIDIGGAEDVGPETEGTPLVGVSASVLKRLSLTSGSLVLVRNSATGVGRIAKVLVLDRPHDGVLQERSNQLHASSSSRSTGILSSYICSSNNNSLSDRHVCYVTPMLAFNLGLHLTCLEVLVREDSDSLKFLFENEAVKLEKGTTSASSFVYVELQPWLKLPKYASHMRISFVKIPECGMFRPLKGISQPESEDRQEMIDKALNDYFKVDRFLVRGDIFWVHINWNCNSEMCIACSLNTSKKSSNNTFFFKITAMEPTSEPLLCINCNQTALVLGGNVASPIPPKILFDNSKNSAPLQVDTVKTLASIVTPVLCPSAPSSKFRVAVLLFGPAGCGKRTVITYIARCLGLHVVEYNCHDLMTSSEKDASTALAQTFNMANGYAPSILLLRNFEVFGKLSSSEGSSSDQVGISSQLASAIRHCTEPVSEDEEHYLAHEENDLYVDERKEVSIGKHRVFLVAAADNADSLQPDIRRCFSHEITMGSLSEMQRVDLLSQTLQGVSDTQSHFADDRLIKDIVGQTSGLMPRDIHALIADASTNLVHKLCVGNDTSQENLV